MRKELAEAVAQLFAGQKAEPSPISDDEAKEIDDNISLVVRLRRAVERDRYSREIEAVLGAEGTARIGLCLERLLAGFDTLGVERSKAMEVVKSVAMDSALPNRRRAYECVRATGHRTVTTKQIAEAMDLPTNTVRRVLQDLTAYGLLARQGQGEGNADLWAPTAWTRKKTKKEPDC